MARHFGGADQLTPLAPEEEPPCAAAMSFTAFCQQLLDWVAEKKGKPEEQDRLNTAYIRLQHRYFDYTDKLSKQHTNERGSRKHRCVPDIHADTYHRLRDQELSLTGLPVVSTAQQARASSYRERKAQRQKSIAEVLLEGE